MITSNKSHSFGYREKNLFCVNDWCLVLFDTDKVEVSLFALVGAQYVWRWRQDGEGR
jgi:hypothetical protein